jgi:hypothetical protein
MLVQTRVIDVGHVLRFVSEGRHELENVIDVGTVVERHAAPGVSEDGYSVEFFDMTGNTVAVVTLPASAFRLPTPADRPAVRALSA